MAGSQAERTRELQPGDRVGGKLDLLRLVADGGMGSLWLARNVTTGAEVAAKLLRAERSADPEAAARFRHEAKVAAMLRHRNIARVFDLLEDQDGSLVLVMEYLRGDTLRTVHETKGTLSCREAVDVVVPILGALQHAHDHGVIHRDIKPSNILLSVDPDGHVTPKLIDFGIAKTVDASVKTRSGQSLGTPCYMSPEQVRARKTLDGRSDLFSIGVVLYELVTGTNPFAADSPSAQLALVLELEVDPDPRIDPRLWLVIQRALSKQAYERHGSAAELAAALIDAMGGAQKGRRPSDPDLQALVVRPSARVRISSTSAARIASTASPPLAAPSTAEVDATSDDARADDASANEAKRGIPRSWLAGAAALAFLALAAGGGMMVRAARHGQSTVGSGAAPARPSPVATAAPPVSLAPPAVASLSMSAASAANATARASANGASPPASTLPLARTAAPPARLSAASSAASAPTSIARTPGF